jgi:triphosphatase
VLVGSTLEAAFDAAPDEINADAVIHASREIASQNCKRAGAAVDSVRYTRLIIELTQWLD